MGYDPDGNHNWTRKKQEKNSRILRLGRVRPDKLQSRWSQPAIKPRPPRHKRGLTWACGNFYNSILLDDFLKKKINSRLEICLESLQIFDTWTMEQDSMLAKPAVDMGPLTHSNLGAAKVFTHNSIKNLTEPLIFHNNNKSIQVWRNRKHWISSGILHKFGLGMV